MGGKDVMKVFLDTNVVIDFCAQRMPFFESASTIIDMAYRKDISIVISSLTLINVAYILKKAFPKETVMHKLKELADISIISPIDKSMIENAILRNSKDFEDCVQCFSAMIEKAELIITRDKCGFEELPLPTFTPQDFVSRCQT